MVTIGWSMGGAVAIEAAHRLSRGALRRSIRGVITIAGQSKGAGNIAALGARGIPLLILHGTGDTCIRSSCAERLFAQAQEPKELRLFEGEDHGVPSALALLQRWIPAALPALCRPGTAQSVEVPCIEAPGHVKCFFTPSDPGNPHRGILVTGAGAGGGPGPGGSFGPYEHYNTLAQTLPAEGIAVLQIVWRKFADLEAATQDMMACMRYPPSIRAPARSAFLWPHMALCHGAFCLCCIVLCTVRLCSVASCRAGIRLLCNAVGHCAVVPTLPRHSAPHIFLATLAGTRTVRASGLWSPSAGLWAARSRSRPPTG